MCHCYLAVWGFLKSIHCRFLCNIESCLTTSNPKWEPYHKLKVQHIEACTKLNVQLFQTTFLIGYRLGAVKRQSPLNGSAKYSFTDIYKPDECQLEDKRQGEDQLQMSPSAKAIGDSVQQQIAHVPGYTKQNTDIPPLTWSHQFQGCRDFENS